jgi:hypothetical protein
MGCDIHAFVEVKISGEWHCYSSPRIGRWYQLFGKIAGVRDEDEKPIVAPKGLPKDVSEVVRCEYERGKGDWHTATWLNAKEIKELCDWVGENEQGWKGKWEHEQLGYVSGNAVYGVPCTEYPPEFQEVRLICWFDS